MPMYKLPEVPHNEELGKRILSKSEKAVLLYGLGTIGKRTFHDFKKMGIAVEAVLDGNPALHGQSYEGIPVRAPEDYAETKLPVVIASSLYYAEIHQQLKRLNISNLLPYYFYLSGKEVDNTEYVAMVLEHNRLGRQLEKVECENYDKFKIRSIDFPITEKCSLRCRDCANLMQYFEKPCNADFDTFIKVLDRLFQIADHIGEVRILGGEPLMNPDLVKYLSAVKAYNSFDYLVLYTNGTILPSEKLLDCLDDKRVIVKISEYGNEKQKCDEWALMLEQRGILYALERVTQWHDCGDIRRYARTDAENMDIFRACCVKNTPSIKDGRLYRCPLAASAAALAACPPEIFQYVDLLDDNLSSELLREKVRELLSLKHHYICEYCGGRPIDMPSIPAARQAAKPVKYRRY